MKVLVIGGGGREHTLAWKLAQSDRISQLYAYPTNGGLDLIAKPLPLQDKATPRELAAAAARDKIDLTIVGPEAYLCDGIVDVFQQRGLRIFGPVKSAARLEGSKIWAKEFMKKNNIPTADFEVFDQYDAALEYVMDRDYPVVVKASGLAAGKGVTVARTPRQAKEALKTAMVDHAFGSSGDRVVIEECLVGQEASVLAFTDGESLLPMLAAQDHKPLLDGDEGPNTGGMGAICPTPLVDENLRLEVIDKVLRPVVRGMEAEGIKYVGVIYAGLMIDKGKCSVLEFNCRFGDPEAQAILPLMDCDLLDLIEASVDGTLSESNLKWREGKTCVTVVMASGGYPGKYERGFPIEGLDRFDPQDRDLIVFHAGTATRGDKVITAGGRVLTVSAVGDSARDARENAYSGVEKIEFKGAQYRTDIGSKALS